MSELRIPAGQSLRQVAERLGIPVEELQKLALVADIEAAMAVDQRIEVPDGFLRVADRNRRSTYAAVPKTTARHRGANEVVTLDIEYRRTRVAGGLHQGKASQNDIDGLADADRAAGRLEADSNELAIDLYRQLTRSQEVSLRAKAYARQSLTEARRYLLYGEAHDAARLRAMSAAKAALMANPKLPEAHVALAHGLDGLASELDETRYYLQRAVDLATTEALPWQAMARRRLADGDLPGAETACRRALELAAEDALALEVAGMVAHAQGDRARCAELLQRATVACPSYANAWARLVHVWRQLGRQSEADSAAEGIADRCRTSDHLALSEKLQAQFIP